jgi:hemolysin III
MSVVHPAQASRFVDTERPSDAAIDRAVPAAARHALNMRFRVEDGNDVALGHVYRPTWRGGIHVIGLVIAVPAVTLLLLSATGDTRLRLGLGVYAVGLCSMLGASATYHRWVHGLRARSVWRRVDHAAVFGAIAGSSTPIVVVAMPGAEGYVLVGAVWATALLGVWCKLSRWSRGDRVGTALYAVTIALGAVAVPWLWVREGLGPSAFVVGGGVAYLVGAACFATRWPVLRPTVFSYHEVWHAFTLIAAMAQFVAIWMLAT